MIPSVSFKELSETLLSLRGRSLIIQEDSEFMLQPIIKEYLDHLRETGEI
jgi:hypothetical protein